MASGRVEWAVATTLWQATQAELAAQLQRRAGLTPEAEQHLGRQLIQDQIDALARERLEQGMADLGPEAERELAAAVFAGLFEMDASSRCWITRRSRTSRSPASTMFCSSTPTGQSWTLTR